MKEVKKTLEGGWCVKCDGSEEFSHYMRDFNFPVAYRFKREGRYYGCTIDGYYILSQTTAVFNNNELTLDELKELIEYAEAQPEQREIVGYECPIVIIDLGIKKGAQALKNEGMYYYFPCVDGSVAIPAELVEAFFTPIYKKTEAEEQADMWGEVTSGILLRTTTAKQLQTKFKLVRNEK